MEEQTSLIIAIVASVIGWGGSVLLCNKIAKEKGINLMGGFFKKLIMVIGGFGFWGLLMLATDTNESDVAVGLLISIGCLVVSSVVLFFINKKANNIGLTIALTILQVLSGFLTMFIAILRLVFGMGFSNTNSGNTTSQMSKAVSENAKKHNEALKKESNEQAEGYARSLGFDSADDAVSSGVNVGKED